MKRNGYKVDSDSIGVCPSSPTLESFGLSTYTLSLIGVDKEKRKKSSNPFPASGVSHDPDTSMSSNVSKPRPSWSEGQSMDSMDVRMEPFTPRSVGMGVGWDGSDQGSPLGRYDAGSRILGGLVGVTSEEEDEEEDPDEGVHENGAFLQEEPSFQIPDEESPFTASEKGESLLEDHIAVLIPSMTPQDFSSLPVYIRSQLSLELMNEILEIVSEFMTDRNSSGAYRGNHDEVTNTELEVLGPELQVGVAGWKGKIKALFIGLVRLKVFLSLTTDIDGSERRYKLNY